MTERKQQQTEKEREENIDRVDEDSFPASDAPPWTGTRAGSPKRKEKKPREEDLS